MSSLDQFFQKKLQKRIDENSFRKLSHTRNLIDFSSNDYLGLAQADGLYRLIQEKCDSLPHRSGASGSRLLSGNSSYIEEVERKLANIFEAEAALIFNSGYAANQAVLSCIPQRGDTILYDELVHACIRDGARLSFAKQHAFRHNDLNDLERKLRQATGRVYVVIESIYSMDGDTCPLDDLVVLAEQFGAFLMIDEAHSTGVIGRAGAGLAVHKNLHHKIPVRVYTFGKAMGCHGACVTGSHDLINYLINFARPFIFTTALPPHAVAAIDCSFSYLKKNSYLQKELTEKIALFKSLTDKSPVKTIAGNSQIQRIIVPGNGPVKKMATAIQAKGFDVRAIMSPTVASGSERLRICLHTFNTDNDIESLVGELSSLQ